MVDENTPDGADNAPPTSGASGAPTPAPGRKMRSLVFFAIVAAVLGTFIVLGRQGRPIDMPGDDVHKLRFTHEGELIGLEGEEGLESAMAPGFVLEKKTIEKRVNARCISCHGDTTTNAETHACKALGTCLTAHHPPKGECIKCHRMPPAPLPPTASTP